MCQVVHSTPDESYRVLIERAWVLYRDGTDDLFYLGENCYGENMHYAVVMGRLGPQWADRDAGKSAGDVFQHQPYGQQYSEGAGAQSHFKGYRRDGGFLQHNRLHATDAGEKVGRPRHGLAGLSDEEDQLQMSHGPPSERSPGPQVGGKK